jgi:hypothetical protein
VLWVSEPERGGERPTPEVLTCSTVRRSGVRAGYARCVHLEQLIGLTVVYTSATLEEGFVVGAVLGLVGYFLSERYRRSRGVTPWRVPSGLWAVLLFLLSLIGVVLYLIACFTTRPKTGPTNWHPGQRDLAERSPGPWNAPPSGQWGPGAPQGWDAPVPGGWQGPPSGYGDSPPPGGWEAAPPPGTAFPGLEPPGTAGGAAESERPISPPPPPRSWLADPGGRHELRYWDGTKFTEHVADGGKISTDPL